MADLDLDELVEVGFFALDGDRVKRSDVRRILSAVLPLALAGVRAALDEALGGDLRVSTRNRISTTLSHIDTLIGKADTGPKD